MNDQHSFFLIVNKLVSTLQEPIGWLTIAVFVWLEFQLTNSIKYYIHRSTLPRSEAKRPEPIQLTNRAYVRLFLTTTFSIVAIAALFSYMAVCLD